MALQSSAKIPAEIWMHLAQFVPHADLCSMFSINRVFFQLSMDARYRELKLDANWDAEMRWRLHRVRDSSIAYRVRHLYINLQYGGRAFYRFTTGSDLDPDKCLLEGIQVMTETVPYLNNVKQFSVLCGHSPPTERLFPFLTVAWKSFGSGLRSLSFGVSLHGLAALLSTADGLVALRDLDVELSGHDFVETHGEALATALAPFVNTVAPTLHSLSYSSSMEHLDDSPFFHRLENIPNLARLRVFVNNTGNILMEEPLSITRFLSNHATTLRHLDLNEGHGCLGEIHLGEQHLVDFNNGKNLEEVFSNLCTLRIRVPQITDRFSLVAQHLRYSAETLTLLEFIGYDMTYEDASSAFAPFARHCGGNLKELCFWAEFLSPELILLLAQTLPRLEKLAIQAKYVIGTEVGKRTLAAIMADSFEDRLREERASARIFADTIRTYDIRGWTLREININAGWDHRLTMQLMSVLAECVPSLQKFCGVEKEFYPCIDPDNPL